MIMMAQTRYVSLRDDMARRLEQMIIAHDTTGANWMDVIRIVPTQEDAMKTIELSSESHALLEELRALYAAKKVFVEDTPKLHQHEELHHLLPKIYTSLGQDIKAHAKITDEVSLHECRVLHNMKVAVGVQHGCTVSVGIWDTDTGMCYYIGEYDIAGCTSV